MSRLFVGNFHFEHELASAPGWHPSLILQRVSAERVASWISLAEDGDWIWTPEPIPEDFWEALAQRGLPRVHGVVDLHSEQTSACEIVPWGWSAWTRALRSQADTPSELAVRKGNSREWSFALEQELHLALPGAAQIERMEQFVETIHRSAGEFGEPVADHAWVVKANFGMAARERLLGRGTTLTPAQQAWLNKRLTADGAVFFEPWLRRRAEVGIQWTLPPLGDGKPKLEGITPLNCDSLGGYRGSEFSLDATIPREWQNAVEVCQQAAQRLQTDGYFGPLGIDAAIYEDAAGIPHVRQLQDINTRYTMGRLALGFRRWLHGAERGVWRHARLEELTPPEDVAILREFDLTPRWVGHRPPTHGSRFWICSE